MSFPFKFPSRLPLPSKDLPLTIISLEQWALVIMNGIDTLNYLQGQFTCNIATLYTDQYSFAAHCNVKGKMYSTMCVFHHLDGIAFITRRSVRNSQLAELKKYAVFSKINFAAIDDNTIILLGVVGSQAQAALSCLFSILPNTNKSVVHHKDTTILYFNLPAERFLLITTIAVYKNILHKLKGQAQFNDSKQWLALDIEAGYPIIDSNTSIQFLPQEANIQALKGINFKKGCYIGQEIIARTKYRGTNKRALYWLAGKTSHIPISGDDLELNINNKWRRTGTVLAACQLEDNSVWVQAILNKNISIDNQLRVRNDGTRVLTIRPLPYVLDED